MHPRLTHRAGWLEHDGDLPVIEGTLIRLQADHLPGDRNPKPMWLWWSGTGALPGDVDRCWQAYLRRFDLETAYPELKSGILGGRVLRARTPAGVDQEVYALLVTYQILRTAMADATSTQPGIDPDRAGFTIALNAARDQLIQAAGVIAGTVTDLAGNIGRLVLDNLLPSRRLRISARTVKRAISKYNARGPNINRTTYKATIAIAILAGPLDDQR